MKKIVLILGLVFAMQTGIMAQVTEGDVVFNAHLLSTLNLWVDGEIQEIYFQTADDYNFGVIESLAPLEEIYPGFTDITVEANEDWKIEIECPDFTDGLGNSIPIGNLGVYVVPTGGHVFPGDVECAYIAPASCKGMTIALELLMEAGANGNAGDVDDNAFTLHWEMGTMHGGMIGTSMFDQMAAPGGFPVGDYNTTATLTLSLD
jgi:hypothetical protein